jgi:hypothetical protein
VTYARSWANAWSLVVATGVGLAMVKWSAPLALVVWGLESLGTAACLVTVRRPGTPSPPRRTTAWRSVAVGGTLVATCAVASTSFPVALLLALVALVTWPRLFETLRRLRRQDATSMLGPAAAPGSQHPAAGGEGRGPSSLPAPLDQPRKAVELVRDLDDHDLCCLWRHTFWVLTQQKDVHLALRMVAVRQACLDELERRNPAAVKSWFDSGARASGGPERFWERRPRAGDGDAA